MSPEQASGETTDKRSDIWSFGVVLFEMLTGQRLFSGKTVSHVLGAVLQVEPTWDTLPTPTPQPLRKLLRRCLEKDRKRRLRDIGDALTDLDETATAEPIDETAVTPAAQPARWRQALPLAVTASVVVSIITGEASGTGLSGSMCGPWTSLGPRPLSPKGSSTVRSSRPTVSRWASTTEACNVPITIPICVAAAVRLMVGDCDMLGSDASS